MKNINEILLHPVRIRIIQEVALAKTITATELCESINDIPRTTMYRYINSLLNYKILTVVSEKKVRGSLERTIALNIEKFQELNTIENSDQNAFGFFMSNYAKFHTYFTGENPNPVKDKIFLNNFVLMLSDAEFDVFLKEFSELVLRNNFKAESGRKTRDISIISAPVEEK